MQNKDLQYRFYIFLSITCLFVPLYQSYYNYQMDKEIHESLEKSNRLVNRYIEINKRLVEARDYWTSRYYGSEAINGQLEVQIDTISQYWSKEHVKLQDELFDLKNKARPLKK
mgnify:FL=1